LIQALATGQFPIDIAIDPGSNLTKTGVFQHFFFI